jgi:MATE family multidrug resistance protein
LHITAYALDGFAFAAEALVGHAFGRRDSRHLRRAAKISSFWGLVSVVILSLGFAVTGGYIIDIMAKVPAVQAEARIYLPYMVIAPVLGLGSYMLDGIFIGATRTRDMRNMMALSLLTYAITAALLIPPFGNHGLWLALLISFIARAVTLGLRYPALERAADGRQ